MISIIEIMKKNQDSSLQMLEEIIIKCPDNLWLEIHGKFPFWQQLFHVIESIDYWIRDNYKGVYEDDIIKSWNTSKNVTYNLDADKVTFEEYLTKEEILEYFSIVVNKSEVFFNNLNDARINIPIAEGNDDFTYLDVIDMQIRHIMYHVGYCICILREYSNIDIEWISHNEY